MIGQTVSHYRILSKLGEGGMGVVYEALDLKLDRHVAVKFLSGRLASDENAKKRFVREAKAASGLEHPNICHIHEIDELPDGNLFMVMPCYEGETLRERLARGPLEIGEALEIAVQMASGLATAHEKGIIHRDIKPGNIMLTDGGRQAKLMDFGLAKTVDSTRVTRSGMAVGTIAYMSPEQVLGKDTDHRTDIWALGLLLYEMLAGRLPFRGDVEAAILYSIVHEEPEPVTRVSEEVPPDVERVIERALEKEPAKRYATMREMLQALEEQRDRLTLGIKRLRFTTMRRRTKRRVIGAGTIAGIVAVAAVLYLLFKPGPPQEAVAKKVTVVDEEGQAAERFVPNTEFRRSFALYPFDNQSGSAENDWIGTAIPLLLEMDLGQDQFLTVQSPFEDAAVQRLLRAGFKSWEEAPWSFKQRLAAASNLGYLVTGSFVVENNEYVITRALHTASNARLVTNEPYRGSSLFSLIDKMSADLKRDAGLPETRPDNPKDLPVSELTTSSVEALKVFSMGAKRGWVESDWTGSIALVERATQIDSTMTIAYFYLSAGLYENGNQGEKVVPTLQLLLRHLYKVPERYQFLARAGYYIMNRDAEKATAVLKMLTELYPADVTGRRMLAGELATRGRGNEAIEEYRRILEIDPERTEAMQEIGKLYQRTGDFTRALEYYEMYAKKNPEDAASFTGIAGVYRDLGEYDRATESYEKALLLEPERVEALTGLARIDDIMGRDEQALEKYAAALRASRSSRDRLDVYWWLQDFYLNRGEVEKALEQMRVKWGELEPAVGLAMALIYKSYDASDMVEVGRRSEGFAVLDTVRKELHPPYDEAADLGYAYAYIALEQADSAESALQRVTFVDGYQLEGLRYFTCFAEGRIAEIRGDYRRAIDRFERGAEISPTFVTVNRYIGRCQRKLGEYDKARASFEKTLKILPNDPKTFYELALLYADKEQMTDAMAAVEKALNVWKNADPGYEPAEEAREKLAEWKRAKS